MGSAPRFIGSDTPGRPYAVTYPANIVTDGTIGGVVLTRHGNGPRNRGDLFLTASAGPLAVGLGFSRDRNGWLVSGGIGRHAGGVGWIYRHGGDRG